jgi:hypothetical protein
MSEVVNGGRKLDRETVSWLQKESQEDGDEAIARACMRALEGDEAATLVVEETLKTRVARAHRQHCRYGHSNDETL